MATREEFTPEEAQSINELFIEASRTDAGKTKIAMTQTQEVSDRLREDSFAEKIAKSRPLRPDEVRQSIVTDSICFVVQMPFTGQRAMTASFRNKPDTRIISAPRFEVGVHKLQSEVFTYEEDDIKAYTTPIVEDARNKITNDMADLQDRQWLLYSETACQAQQKYTNGIAIATAFSDTTSCTAYNITAGTCTAFGKIKSKDAVDQSTAASAAAGVVETKLYPLQKDDLIALRKLFLGNGGQGSRLQQACTLMTESDLLDTASWTNSDVGDKIPGDTAYNGVKTSVLLGVPVITTIKTDILRPGNIYGFTSQEFLGGIRTYGNMRYFTDVKRTVHEFSAERSQGMFIHNVAAVRKLELYGGSSDEKSGTSNAGVKALFSPVAEYNLGKKNNLVAEGYQVPDALVDF